MRKLIAVFMLFMINPAANALINEIYYDDGATYVVNTDRRDDRFWVDWERSEPLEPATQLSFVTGGQFAEVRAGGNSIISVNGGVMYGEQTVLTDNAVITLLSGTMQNGMTAGPGTIININGGLIQTHFTSTFNTSGTLNMTSGEIDHLFFHNSAVGSIVGGVINEFVYVEDNSTVTFTGVFDQGYVTISHDPANGSYTTGIISGHLWDNTPIDISYFLYDQGQIVLTPEPGCIFFLLLGLAKISRKR